VALFANIFINNILPAFLVMGAGILLDRALGVDKKSLSRTALYVLTPCLIFSLILESSIEASTFGLMLLFVAVITIVMCIVGLVVGHLLRWPARTADALVLSVAFLNAGNLGLSVILFSFGEEGLELASAFFVASMISCNTLAAFFAARNSGGARKAVLKVLQLPSLYAFLAALLLRGLSVTMPETLLKPISLIARASVPIMLMMLGLQLSQTRLRGRYKDVSVGVVLRLVVGSLAAVGLARLFGLAGLVGKVAITEASMPTAVTSLLMAIEFDGDADYVSSVIFASTILSALTLTVLLSLLG